MLSNKRCVLIVIAASAHLIACVSPTQSGSTSNRQKERASDTAWFPTWDRFRATQHSVRQLREAVSASCTAATGSLPDHYVALRRYLYALSELLAQVEVGASDDDRDLNRGVPQGDVYQALQQDRQFWKRTNDVLVSSLDAIGAQGCPPCLDTVMTKPEVGPAFGFLAELAAFAAKPPSEALGYSGLSGSSGPISKLQLSGAKQLSALIALYETCGGSTPVDGSCSS